jgi:nitronate monooxygenase
MPAAATADGPRPVRIRTRFTERFGLEHPIVCAPMALVTGARLAGAVSAAGGLGILGGGYCGTLGGEPDLADDLAQLAGQRFGVGFITWALASAPHVLPLALSHRPAFVFLSFGDPRPFAAAIHASGAELICQIQSLHHLDQALEAGATVIVAQGTEAGGHGAGRSTLPLVPEVRDALERRAPGVLLLAAGGVADGRGLAAALMLGADAALVGTRFWASAEALTPDAATDRAIAGSGDDTVRTSAVDALRGVPWPPEFSFRIIRNMLTDEWGGREAEARQQFGSLAREYARARAAGDLSLVATVAGECIGLIRDRPPAQEIVARMVAEALACFARAATGDFR